MRGGWVMAEVAILRDAVEATERIALGGRNLLAGLFVAGGLLGGLLGARSAKSLSNRKGALTTTFAIVIFAVAIYMLVRSLNVI